MSDLAHSYVLEPNSRGVISAREPTTVRRCPTVGRHRRARCGDIGHGSSREALTSVPNATSRVGLVAPAPTLAHISFSIANARVHATARLTACYREVLRTSARARPRARIIGRTTPTQHGAGSSLSRVATGIPGFPAAPILARRATPPTGKHGTLPPALDFYAPRLSSLTRAESPTSFSNMHHM